MSSTANGDSVIESFRIIPGDGRSTVIIHVPHSSRVIPADVRAGIVLDDAALESELNAMTDAFTDVIAEQAASQSGMRPWLFVNNLSRLVIDPERFPDEREEMNAVGMGAVYTKGSNGQTLRNLSDDEISGLVGRYFTPYAEALTQLVDDRLAAVTDVTIIDLHSYPLEPNGYESTAPSNYRPEVCVGTHPFHTPQISSARCSRAFMTTLGSSTSTSIALSAAATHPSSTSASSSG